jgi:hypothetical protein
MIENAIAIYPIYIVPAPRPLKNSISSGILNGNSTDLINSQDLTGVTRVRKELNNFGKGVRVRKSQTCIVLIAHSIPETGRSTSLLMRSYNPRIILHILKRSTQRFLLYSDISK